ncbi:unnamed protein product [Medioppia subpectinata]|uniref:Uncharacterized protein n=1 Tax=Medioppia subpectinata TaxID=1979941 RepID=A0A7R9Q0B5_9ACAR|nr:unnamed protein product [Medioppia subpectinata]CAG2107948.1 unnamed protein product [Medioppia subpectinata]
MVYCNHINLLAQLFIGCRPLLYITYSISGSFLADLVASTEEEKNYKGICIAICVIGCICSLIITSIILLTPDDGLKRVRYPRLRVDEIVSNVFQPKDFDGIWISEIY